VPQDLRKKREPHSREASPPSRKSKEQNGKRQEGGCLPRGRGKSPAVELALTGGEEAPRARKKTPQRLRGEEKRPDRPGPSREKQHEIQGNGPAHYRGGSTPPTRERRPTAGGVDQEGNSGGKPPGASGRKKKGGFPAWGKGLGGGGLGECP